MHVAYANKSIRTHAHPMPSVLLFNTAAQRVDELESVFANTAIRLRFVGASQMCMFAGFLGNATRTAKHYAISVKHASTSEAAHMCLSVVARAV